ncbi:MAG: hypothetical protein U0704_08675 [Candidatus Eisenbacteria bacterium]
MTVREACLEFARLLREVADGRMSAAEALARRPQLAPGTAGVPVTWGSAVAKLEIEAEFPVLDEPATREAFAAEWRALADRLEARAPRA